MKGLQGKVAVVTGGSSGIGQAIAVRLGEEGMNVAVNYVGRPEGAQQTAEAIDHGVQLCMKQLAAHGAHPILVEADVSDEAQVVEMFENHMSSILYWTQTNNAKEKNAKERILQLLPGWSYEEAVIWLAATYPRGLAHAGISELDERLLPVETADFEEEVFAGR